MAAKVADFGLSKLSPGVKSSGVSTGVKSTFGYLDPEYLKTGKLTHKSDVYSYGVVLAELMTGRLPYHDPTNSGSGVILMDWMKKKMEKNDINALADPNLRGQFDPESMWKVAELALKCVDPITAKRPDFTQVAIGLQEAFALQKRKIWPTHSLQSVPSQRYCIPRSYSSHPHFSITE